ncbi:hypothetical protein, partial [Klebsiella pneumoniae]|uniref:hypothetical protein n=1 Tax=Klebsiella pneumoniae TaxID=573 RepID=UPI001EEF0CD4
RKTGDFSLAWHCFQGGDQRLSGILTENISPAMALEKHSIHMINEKYLNKATDLNIIKDWKGVSLIL